MPQPIQGMAAAAALTEAFALTGKLPLQLDEIVVPVVSIGGLDQQSIWGPRCVGSIALPAGGAANNHKVEIALPISTTPVGLAVLIESIAFQSAGATSEVLLGPSPGLAAPTHAGVTRWADVRTRGLPQVQISAKNDAVPSAVVGVLTRFLGANSYSEVPINWTIGPHPDTGVLQGLYVEYAVLNNPTYTAFYWRERLPR